MEHHPLEESVSLPDLRSVLNLVSDVDLSQLFHNLTSEEDLSAVPRVFSNADARVVPAAVTAERLAQAPTSEHDPESQSVAVTFEEAAQASAPEHNPRRVTFVEQPTQASYIRAQSRN